MRRAEPLQLSIDGGVRREPGDELRVRCRSEDHGAPRRPRRLPRGEHMAGVQGPRINAR